MSYSFVVAAATAAAALQAVGAKFDEVVSGQPVHERDREAALAAVEAVCALVAAPAEGEEVRVSVSGWLSWTAGVNETEQSFYGAGVSVSVNVGKLQGG